MSHTLHSSTPRPLTAAEAEASRREHGSNQLSVKGKKSFFRQFIGNLGDPVIRILLGALILNVLFSIGGDGADWAETGGIALAVLLATRAPDKAARVAAEVPPVVRDHLKLNTASAPELLVRVNRELLVLAAAPLEVAEMEVPPEVQVAEPLPLV